MPKTQAEYQRGYRQRQAADRAELARLRTEREHLDEYIASLEAQLEQAASQHSGSCHSCGSALACPSCQRGDEFA